MYVYACVYFFLSKIHISLLTIFRTRYVWRFRILQSKECTHTIHNEYSKWSVGQADYTRFCLEAECVFTEKETKALQFR